jgi:hypothetical protein
MFFHRNFPNSLFAFTLITADRSGLLNPDLIKRSVNLKVCCNYFTKDNLSEKLINFVYVVLSVNLSRFFTFTSWLRGVVKSL